MSNLEKCKSAVVRAWAEQASQATLDSLGPILYRSPTEVLGVLSILVADAMEPYLKQRASDYLHLKADQERLMKDIDEALARLAGLED